MLNLSVLSFSRVIAGMAVKTSFGTGLLAATIIYTLIKTICLGHSAISNKSREDNNRYRLFINFAHVVMVK